MFKSTLNKFIVLSLFVCFLIVGQEGQVRAQVALPQSPWIILEGAALGQANKPATLASHLKYQIVALDAQTHGKVSSDTTQIILILRVVNDSPNYYNRIIFTHPDINLLNTATGTTSKTFPYNSLASITQQGIFAFSTYNFVLTNQPVAVSANFFINHSITAQTFVIAQLFNLSNTSSTPDGMLLSLVEDPIYEPSNDDLIPSISNGVTNIWNRLVQYVRTII